VTARRIFYSFHFDNDYWRVNQIRHIGSIEGQPILAPNVWEEVRRKGNASIQKWIDDNMVGRSCVIVLIGSQTAGRQWVDYEIEKAWNEKKGLLGVYIHNLLDSNQLASARGANPFARWTVGATPMTQFVRVYDPPFADSKDVYSYIANGIAEWVEAAISARRG